MKVLGIETSTILCGVGLADQEGLVADYRLLRGYTHAERLPEAVEKILKDADLSAEQLDGIAVSIGPGSFTGLRIGLGVAKGLAFGLQKHLVAVPTMDALISQIPHVCEWAMVMLKARKGEIYQGIYRWENGSWKQVGDYKIVQEEQIGKNLPDGEILFLGEGATCYREILQQRRKKPRFLPPFLSLPSGYGVAVMGLELLQVGEIAYLDSLVPLYLKRFQGVT